MNLPIIFMVPLCVGIFLWTALQHIDETQRAMIYVPKDRAFYRVELGAPIKNLEDLGRAVLPFWDRRYYDIFVFDELPRTIDGELKNYLAKESEIPKSRSMIIDTWLLPRTDLKPLDLLPPEWARLPDALDDDGRLQPVDVVFWQQDLSNGKHFTRTIRGALYLPTTAAEAVNGYCFSVDKFKWPECKKWAHSVKP